MRNSNLKLTAFIITMCLSNLACLAQFSGGDGSAGNPYQITNRAQLEALHNKLGPEHRNVHYVLMNDINLSGEAWIPIGYHTSQNDIGAAFRGKLHGNNKKIVGIEIGQRGATTYKYAGLFGFLSNGAYIENLHLEGGTIKGWEQEFWETKCMAGSIAGKIHCKIQTASDSVCIIGCTNSAEIISLNSNYPYSNKESYVGGIVGYVEESVGIDDNMNPQIHRVSGKVRIDNCVNRGTIVKGNSYANVGGIVGAASESTYGNAFEDDQLNVYAYGTIEIKNCINYGRIQGEPANYTSTGGIIGFSKGFGYAYSYGAGTGFGYSTIKINSCISYCDSISEGRNSYLGGIIGNAVGRGAGNGYGKPYGRSSIMVEDCVSNTYLSGDTYTHVGGIAGKGLGSGIGLGYSYGSGTFSVTNSTNHGNVKGYVAGGIIGTGEATGDGDIYVGTEGGIKDGMLFVTNCVNMGNVTGSGGIIGQNSNFTYGVSTVEGCLNYGMISGEENVFGDIGGLIGSSSGTLNISACGNFGAIQSFDSRSVGGIVGTVSDIDLKNCYNHSSIYSYFETADVGGIIGTINRYYDNNKASFEYAYSNGSISAKGTDSQVGGLIGNIHGRGEAISVRNSLVALAFMDGGASTHRVIGAAEGDNITIHNNYANSSLLLNGINIHSTDADSNEGADLNEESLYKKETYTNNTYKLGWDFDTNWMLRDNLSHPYFKFQSAPVHLAESQDGLVQLNVYDSSQQVIIYKKYISKVEKELNSLSQGLHSIDLSSYNTGDTLFFVNYEKGKMPSYPVSFVIPEKQPSKIFSIVNANSAIYPNLSDGIVYFRCPDSTTDCKVSVYDAAGNQVYDKEDLRDGDQIDLSFCAKGLYLVRLLIDSKTRTEKIILK